MAYTFVGALCTTAMIYAFRAGWVLHGWQFVATWFVVWLFAHANWLTLDIFTVWLPPELVPMALITWIVFNVTSVLLPFELSNGFYSWAYVTPAHEVFVTLTDIWSAGCFPHLRYSLPVLFIIELTSLVFSTLGVYRRAHYASIGDDRKEKEFQERIDAAVAVQRKRDAQLLRPEGEIAKGAEGETEDFAREDLEKAEKDTIAREAEEDEQALHPLSRGEPISFAIFDPAGSYSSQLTRARTAI
jgi:hypothetical protein